MALGLDQGVVVTVAARGADAPAAAKALAEMIATLEADAKVAPAPKPPAPAPAAIARAVPQPPFPEGQEVLLSGVMASPGMAIGRAARIERREYRPAEAGAGEAVERARLDEAIAKAQSAVKGRLAAAKSGGAAHEILSAHLTFLEDPELRVHGRR